MTANILIVGGGIAGLSASIALSPHHQVALIEQNHVFQEVGAGLQISPNAWRCLRQWGLEDALMQVCSLPETMVARSLATGQSLGKLPLGAQAQRQFGAPYGTVLRADLHRILLDKATQSRDFSILMGCRITELEQTDAHVHLYAQDETELPPADALLLADGARSALGHTLLPQLEVVRSGYTAYRGLLRQSALPQPLRSNQVCAWLGKNLHAVTYPVRQGEFLNIVLVAADHTLAHVSRRGPADIGALLQTLEQQQSLYPRFKNLCMAVDSHGMQTMGARWTEWPLQIRKPVAGPQELASGRVALVGDAAHPMVPFLAQGAAMGIEDAEQLSQSLRAHPHVPEAFAHYASRRAARCAKVQKRALRNGRIFHLSGPLALGRNLAIKVMTQQTMSQPWLYAGGPVPH